jgi:hypothetical protein
MLEYFCRQFLLADDDESKLLDPPDVARCRGFFIFKRKPFILCIFFMSIIFNFQEYQ